MATVANRDGTSAMAKGLAGCAAVGTFFSIIDTIRNHTFHNFSSVCIFGLACWGLLKIAARIKQPSFASAEQVQRTDAVLGQRFGTPGWVRPAIWAALFLVMLMLFAALFRYRSALNLPPRGLQFALMVVFGLYLLCCQQAERLVRTYLRRWYADEPQVAIGAEGLWITGTEIPWSAIRGIERRTRRLKVIGVDTIVVKAQAGKRVDPIEIDLSDSLEDPEELFAKLRSAVAAHGAPATPVQQSMSALSDRNRELTVGTDADELPAMGFVLRQLVEDHGRLRRIIKVVLDLLDL